MLRRLQVEVINRCNLRCPLCRTLLDDDVVRTKMSLAELGRVLAPVAEQLDAVTLHGTRGEPSSSVTRARRPSLAEHRAAHAPERWGCASGLDMLYVDPSAACYPCCYAEGHARMRLGNALETPLDRIYQQRTLRHIRRSFEDGTDHHPFCVERCSDRPLRRKRRLRLAYAQTW